jgi:AAA+ ATPase superfamily predicted ATPase
MMINRETEQAQLRAAQDGAPSLVVIMGRRRVGKSFLLAETLTGERVVSFQGDEQGEAQQLELLAEEAGRVLLGAPALRFDDWEAALTFFGAQAAQAPLTLVLDEFQYLWNSQAALDSIIQRHWDRWQRQGVPVTLVLCGSALSLMEKLLAHGSPLYGRATARPLITPLDYRFAAEFARTNDPERLLRRYAVIGGTPQYQVWAGQGELSTIIRERILTKGAPLYEDPLHLLREGEGIRDPGTYLSILAAIARGATHHNEIAQQAGITTGNLSKKIERLEELGYVRPVFPIAADGREDRSVYQIADPFFRFWFRYVARNRSRLERGRVDEVLAEVMDDLDNLMGLAFEDCCRQWVGRYADEDRVGRPEQIGSWWSRDGSVEIDIVGVRRHRYQLLGSCKWRRTVDEDVLDQLYEHRAALGGSAARARLALFARDGFSDRVLERANDENLLLVTAADLFA